MIGLVGILGCIAGAVLAAISIAVTIVDVAYAADANNKREASAKAQNSKQEEKQKQAEIMQMRQARLARDRALQSSGTSALFDSLQAESGRHETRELKKKLHRPGSSQIVRPERHFGTIIR